LQYGISLELEPQHNGVFLLRITFAVDLLPVEQANILLNQFEILMTNLVNDPHNHHGKHTYSSQIQDLFSIIPAKCPVLSSPVEMLHQFVELGAQKYPERIAFQFATHISSSSVDQKSWTYKELDEEGNMVADLIKKQGVAPGSLIATCFDKCPEASFAILGILKAGCAYVALDPGAPLSRKLFIVSDSGANLVLTSNRRGNHFATATRLETSDEKWQDWSINTKGRHNTKTPIVYLDEIPSNSFSRAQPDIAGGQTPDSTCYCLYTSGTTGTPKGCEITHENAVQAMRAFSRLFSPRWNENSRWLQFASFHFDVSVLEQYWSWSEGIQVVSAPRDLIFEDLAGTIRALGVTHIDLTPSLASLLHPDDVPSLCDGVFITGGEQLKQEILDVWGPKEVIHNGYGPTEATIGVTMFTRVPANGKPSNIGWQFDNVGTYVLEPGQYEPVLRGSIGELCISGKLVGRGYLNRPELTEEKFPFVEHFKEQIYRTGDLVRLLWDGSFIFIGRADDQVKLRGQRLEIGEINATIRRGVTSISEVATYVLKHPKQKRDQLVTFFTISKGEKQINEARIRQDEEAATLIGQTQDACRAKLPAYMTPTHFIPVTKLPLTANNKIDAQALRRLFNETSFDQLQALSTRIDDAKALSTTEKKVAGVLGAILSIGIEDVRPTSNIFELGMDSILVLRFTRALKAAGFDAAQPSLIMTREFAHYQFL
jgi:amino acid adenylation domain-containing protein